MMKKLVSVVLCMALLLSSAVVAAFAAEGESEEKNKLGVLLDYFTQYEPMMGDYTPYDTAPLWDQVQVSSGIYRDETAGDADYAQASADLLNALYHIPISPYYAYDTALKAAKLKNVNNYYDKQGWAEFQRCCAVLRSSLGKGTNEELQRMANDAAKSQEITELFHQLLHAYNRLTQTGFVKGDVNGDGRLTVDDVTETQRYLAGIVDLAGAQIMRGRLTGASATSEIGIADVTAMQRIIAEYKDVYEPPVAVIGAFETGESEEYLYSHLFHYDICPETFFGMGLHAVFYNTVYFQGLYRYCAERGITL